MDNYPLIRKCLVVGIIFLFVGVVVPSSINFSVVKASYDEDFVEVITQACGVNGFGNTTIKLTREQYQNLEWYLVEFEHRLNQTITRAEAIQLFKESVIELDKYGLLPKGMNRATAERLVTGGHQCVAVEQLFKKSIIRNQGYVSDKINALCSIFIVGYGPEDNGVKVCGPIARLFSFFTPIFSFLIVFHPICFLCTIMFGQSGYLPSNCAILSVGTFGIVVCHRPIYGAIPVKPIPVGYPWGTQYYYPGIMGFSGIQILTFTNTYYLGSALYLQTSSEPPEEHQ